MDHWYSVRIEYPSEEYAVIVRDALSVEKELRPEMVQREITADGSTLVASFQATTLKGLRVSVGGFFDFLLLATRTLDTFGTE